MTRRQMIVANVRARARLNRLSTSSEELPSSGDADDLVPVTARPAGEYSADDRLWFRRPVG